MRPAKYDENRNFARRLLRLSPPIMLQEFITTGSAAITIIIVGYLGVYDITAVGIANRLYFLFQMTCFGVNSGCAVLIGQFWGRGDIKSIHKSMGIAFALGLAFACVFACAAVFAPECYMSFFSNKNPEVVALGIKYLRVVSISYFIIAICETLKYALRGVGETRMPVASSAMALLANAFFCWLFVVALGFGVAGAALALIISRVLELAVLVVLMVGYRLPVVTSLGGYFKAKRAFVSEYFKISLPVIMNEVFWAIGTLLYTYSYSFTGAYGQGAVQISQSVIEMFQVVGMAIGSGCGIMIANALGAGEIDEAKRYAGKCLKLTAIVCVVMGGILAAFSPFIVNAYNVPEEAKNYARQVLLVLAVGMPFKSLNYAMIAGILRNGGDTTFCLLVDFASVWFVGLPLSYICARYTGMPVYVVTAAVYCEEVFKVVVCAFRMRQNKWARNLIADL